LWASNEQSIICLDDLLGNCPWGVFDNSNKRTENRLGDCPCISYDCLHSPYQIKKKEKKRRQEWYPWFLCTSSSFTDNREFQKGLVRIKNVMCIMLLNHPTRLLSCFGSAKPSLLGLLESSSTLKTDVGLINWIGEKNFVVQRT